MRGPTEFDDREVTVLLQQAQGGGRDGELFEDAVGLARLEAQDLRVLVHAEVDADLVEVGQLRVRVAWIAGDGDIGALVPLLHEEGSGAHGAVGEVLAALLHGLLWDGPAGGDGEAQQEGGGRLLQRDLEGVVVDDLDALDRLGLARGKGRGALDWEEVAGAPALDGRANGLGIEAAQHAVGHVRRRHLARLEVGTGEHGAGLDAEGVDEAILGHFRQAVRQPGFQLALRVEVIETLVEGARDHVVVEVEGLGVVQGDQVIERHQLQPAASQRLLILGQGDGSTGGDGPCERHDDQHGPD